MGLGAKLIFAIGAAAFALQVLFGVIGSGLAILLIVDRG
jgi:hypothetical protein